jgi:hypothetical protein
VVAVRLEQGAVLLDEGAHLVLVDVEEVGDQRGGQAALVQESGPDDVIDGQFAVAGALFRWQRVDHVADLGDEVVEDLASEASQNPVSGQGHVESVGRVGVGSASARMQEHRRHARLRWDGVVPFAVEVVGVDLQRGGVLRVDLDPGGVAVLVQPCGDAQPGQAIRFKATSKVVSGRVRQFTEMKENSRCSTLFHFDVPGQCRCLTRSSNGIVFPAAGGTR